MQDHQNKLRLSRSPLIVYLGLERTSAPKNRRPGNKRMECFQDWNCQISAVSREVGRIITIRTQGPNGEKRTMTRLSLQNTLRKTSCSFERIFRPTKHLSTTRAVRAKKAKIKGKPLFMNSRILQSIQASCVPVEMAAKRERPRNTMMRKAGWLMTALSLNRS